MREIPEESGHGRDGALAALLEAAQSADTERFGRPLLDSFESDDYQDIIDLAWRYQFDDDRSKFKGDFRRLQQHVSERIFARLELDE